jgi:lysophospholipase L1-like esterase
LRLLIVGDSAAAGVGAATQHDALAGQLVQQLAPRYDLQWRLLASSGDTTDAARARLEAEPALACDVALTSLGVNDVTALRRTATTLRAQQRLVAHLRERCGARVVLVSGIPPMRDFPALPQPLRWMLGRHARRLDDALVEWIASQPGCEHLPFGDLPDAAMMASDGFHPGPPIYALWAAAVARRIDAAFGSSTVCVTTAATA